MLCNFSVSPLFYLLGDRGLDLDLDQGLTIHGISSYFLELNKQQTVQ